MGISSNVLVWSVLSTYLRQLKLRRGQLNVGLANSDALGGGDNRHSQVVLLEYIHSVRDLETQTRALTISCDVISQNCDDL